MENQPFAILEIRLILFLIYYLLERNVQPPIKGYPSEIELLSV